jgi:serine/threonine protein kinase
MMGSKVHFSRGNATIALNERYHILRLLGQGVYSSVSLCEDTLTGERVAVKQYLEKGHIPSEEFAILATLAQAQCPGIPSLLSAFFEQDRWYLVMQYIDGPTLKDYREQVGGKLPAEEVRTIGLHLALTLENVHEQGIIYRDLKPANVILARYGRAMLIDFGSASRSTVNDCFTAPRYAAPEQKSKQPTIDHRADIYTLGVLLHELLIGHCSSHEPLSERQAEDLRLLCLRMMNLHPAKRPQTMREVRMELAS